MSHSSSQDSSEFLKAFAPLNACILRFLLLFVFSSEWILLIIYKLMGRSFLKCFRPENRICVLTEDASAFCLSLAEDIEKLEMSLAKDSISLKWCFGTMSLLKRMQQDLLGLLKESKLPIAYGAEDDWFDQYMKESSTLLDFCNSLKIAVSGINRYRMLVNVVARRLTEQSSSTLVMIQKMEHEYLEKVHGKSLDVCLGSERLKLGNECLSDCTGKNEKSMAVVLLAARATMIVLSLFLMSAMTYPISINIATEMFSSECLELNQIVQILSAVVNTFSQQILSHDEDCRAVLVEHKMVEMVLRDLKEYVVKGAYKKSEKFLSGLNKLRTRSCELREGIDKFSTVVDEVFEEVIRGRDDMIGTLRTEV